jgi:hypothetical protein
VEAAFEAPALGKVGEARPLELVLCLGLESIPLTDGVFGVPDAGFSVRRLWLHAPSLCKA